MKTIVEGLAIEYSDEGQGPVILMLHGWADNLHTWDPIIKEFSGYRIVRFDFPGFGGSERPKGTWGVEEYARFVQVFCKKLQLKPAVLIGHSFGGRVIIKGVGTGLLQPKKVILIASAGVAKIRTGSNHALRLVAKVGKAITTIPPFSRYRHFLRKKLYAAIGSDYFASGSMSDIFRKVVSEDLLPFAQHINVPTLLIWGANDHSTPLEIGKRIHKATQNSQLKIIDGASHFVHQEKPQEVASLIQDFV